MKSDPVQEQIIEEFSIFDDWHDKYEYLIGLSAELPPIDHAHRTDQYIIKGCQSRVWIDATVRDGKLYFSADSDSIISKGIISLIIRVLNGRMPREVLDADLYFIDRIGLDEHLSLNRANGLPAMIKQMKLFALAYLNKVQE